MQRALKYLIPIALLALFGVLILFFVKRPASIDIMPSSLPAPGVSAEAGPTVTVGNAGTSTLSISWENLPGGTERLSIFRTPAGKNLWLNWKTVVAGSGSGSAEVQIGSKENLNSYAYYFQATSGSGDPLYTSSAAQPQTSGSPGGDPSTPIGGFNLVMAPSTSTPQPPPQSGFNLAGTETSTPPPTTQFNLSNTSTQPAPTSTGTTSSQPVVDLSTLPTSSVTIFMKGIFYSPFGIVPVASGVQDADFWVLHVNGAVEVGWQNAASSTNAIAIYRSIGESGPWSKVLEQAGVDPSAPNFVRFIDSSSGAAHYYRMEALQGATVLATYGPLLLPALGT